MRNFSPFTRSMRNAPRVTRRHFIGVAATGLTAMVFPTRTVSQPGASVPSTGATDPKLAKYDELMVGFVREHKPPGAALAVTHGGRLVYARGFGYADVEKKEPVQPTSLFRIASTS